MLLTLEAPGISRLAEELQWCIAIVKRLIIRSRLSLWHPGDLDILVIFLDRALPYYAS